MSQSSGSAFATTAVIVYTLIKTAKRTNAPSTAKTSQIVHATCTYAKNPNPKHKKGR